MEVIVDYRLSQKNGTNWGFYLWKSKKNFFTFFAFWKSISVCVAARFCLDAANTSWCILGLE
jgi:hypothetical protein